MSSSPKLPSSALLNLPNEILCRIFEITAYDKDEPHVSLLNASRTCRRLHQICQDDNASHWREACLFMGLPTETHLQDLLYPAQLEDRSWRDTYKRIWNSTLSYPREKKPGWKSKLPKWMRLADESKKTQRALRTLPKDKRILVQFATGSAGNKYKANCIVEGNESILQIQESVNEINMTETRLNLNTGQIKKTTRPAEQDGHIFPPGTLHPSDSTWQAVSHITSYGTTYHVFLCSGEGLPFNWDETSLPSFFHESNIPYTHVEGVPHRNDILLCYSTTTSNPTPNPLWKTRLPRTILTSIPAALHLTPTLAIIQHATHCIHRQRLEGAPGFSIFSLYTGFHIHTLSLTSSRFGKSLTEHRMRFNTGFDLPPCILDSALISGGPDGALLLWSILPTWQNRGIVAVLPDPNQVGGFRRRYASLRVTQDGKCVVGVLSDRVTLWDLQSRLCLGSWVNGRGVKSGTEFQVNPNDGFEEGVWVGFKIEGEERMQVAYLTGKELETGVEKGGEMLSLGERVQGWMTLGGLLQGEVGGAVAAGLFAVVLSMVWYCWGTTLGVWFGGVVL